MQLFEMQGLLAGKCLPGDMFVGESLSEYFLRQFNQRDELGRQVSALQLSHDNIINSLGIKGDGPVSKLVIEHVMGLVAENAAMRKALSGVLVHCPINDPDIDKACSAMICNDALQSTPATDAAIAEINAQGVDEYACYLQEIVDSALQGGHEITAEDTKRKIFMARGFAANLRAGRKG